MLKHPTLLTDFYEFTMAYVYFKQNRHEDMVYFDMFARKHPDENGYLIFNGLANLIQELNNFKFTEEELDYLASQGLDDPDFLDYLRKMSFSLTISAVPDGTVVFKNEPLITVYGKLIECQLIETLLLVSINFSTLIATKASRLALASEGRAIAEFGARRAQGTDASIEGAKAALIGGAKSTSNTLSGFLYDIPISGTMAHSFIQLYPNEYDAFLAYAQIFPDNCILLVDTYNTLHSGIPNAIQVAKDYLIPNGYRLKAIRLDSGDLAYLSKQARILLDQAGLEDCQIVASNSLDEETITNLLVQGAQIDAFGIGEKLITSASSPVLSGVYKIVALEEGSTIKPLIKLSDNPEKVTNPGYKKLYRFYDKKSKKAMADYIALAHETIPQDSITIFDPEAIWKQKTLTNYQVEELHTLIYDQGRLVYDVPPIQETIQRVQNQLDTLWDEVKRLVRPHNYYVDLSQELYDLKVQLINQNRSMKVHDEK